MRRLASVIASLGALVVGSFGLTGSAIVPTGAESPAPAESAPQEPAAQPGRSDRDEQPPKPEQWRSYWVDSFNTGIYSPAQVSELVDAATAANANVLIVQVGRWMDCFCNRSAFPRTHVEIDPPPYDPLDEVIEQAHAAGLQVHAWVNATPMWNLATPPPQPDHVFHRHGPSATGADRWLNRRVDGKEVAGETMRVIDVANPAATDYVVQGIRSIVREYDVDGINLDYIRYPDDNTSNDYSDWGYSAVSLARFRAATGRTDVPDPADPEFSQWRRDQVTNYVRKIYLTMYDVDPTARLSINGITYWYGPQTEGGWERTRTYAQVLQDWKAWLAEGIIDVNVAMNYKDETNEGDRIQMFDEWNDVLADTQGKRYSVVGPGLYLNTLAGNLAQTRRALAPSAAGNRVVGWSGYSYANPSSAAVEAGTPAAGHAERRALTEALTIVDPTGAKPLFAEPAAVPSMPWKDDPTTGHVHGRVLNAGGTPVDHVTVTATNPRTGERTSAQRTDGSGWFGLVDLAPGTWLVRVELPDGFVGRPMRPVSVVTGELARVTFTVVG